MLYKPDLAQVVARHRQLWSRQLPNGILAILDVEDAPWDPYNLPAGFKSSEMDPLAQSPDIERMFRAWDLCYARRRELRDDSLPVARMGLGGYEFGGMLGGELVFSGSGAPWLARPPLSRWDALDTLRLDEQNPWYRHRLEMCRYFARNARGKFGCSEADNFTSLNLVELLRGSQAYLDLIDNPDACRQAMMHGVEWTEKLIRVQRAELGDARVYDGGSFHNFCIWLPGNAVWFSMDSYGQCRPGLYQRMGQEFDQALIDRLGGGWIHMHSNGLHILPDIMGLRGLRGLEIWSDPPPAPAPFAKLEAIRLITGDVPLMIHCELEEFEKGLRDATLPGGIIYQVDNVASVEAGNALMTKVRTYRARPASEPVSATFNGMARRKGGERTRSAASVV